MQSKKAALVTGGSRGIGRAVSIALAATDIPVFVNYKSGSAAAEETCAAIQAAGGIATPIQADVSDRDSVKKMFGQIRDSGYWVHTLVNNAGIVRDQLCAMMSASDWRDVLGTNLDSAFYCIREAAATMISRRGGQIVNMASVSGLRGQPGQANYGAAKAGLAALTRTLAREVGRYNIRVNAVAPGFIDTDMLRELNANPRSKAVLDEARDRFIPLGRFGTVEDVARSVAFLASPAASYITGHVLVVDGGMSI
jgi:3-oxoacyl-[acyl-carrier protein] reductase